MPRSIEISASPERVDALLARIERMQGIVSVARQRNASLSPPGDVLTIAATTDASRSVLGAIEAVGIVEEGSFSTSDVNSLVSDRHREDLDRESNEAPWDEMAFLLRKDANLTANYLMAMFLSGAIAAGGLWTDTLHLVIAAMLVAPGFEPLVRPPLGMLSGTSRMVSGGISSAIAGYGLMALGGALMALLLSKGNWGPAAAFGDQQWAGYWSTVSFPGVLVSAFAAVAGAIVISGHRSVLTTGVMIGLALIPSMTMVGMGVAIGDIPLAANAALRWAIDAFLVLLMSTLVFAIKKKLSHRRHRAQS